MATRGARGGGRGRGRGANIPNLDPADVVPGPNPPANIAQPAYPLRHKDPPIFHGKADEDVLSLINGALTNVLDTSECVLRG
ncbi:hypothetical protein DAPPUDRAFT_259508 [Daphnia pulex]|uniref:Uncharacterized protein n=1 Tax=Daphnia pulex TaxID=6669 RepID=E9HHC4_DAPPU|nr:hypothetical protein DAPPUDRAFT_259508 [Daphnia pulex]|eukprot:EFX68868.1 hypothetical protein DAPPUDRAFT_259508 [Daphnia pulex]